MARASNLHGEGQANGLAFCGNAAILRGTGTQRQRHGADMHTNGLHLPIWGRIKALACAYMHTDSNAN